MTKDLSADLRLHILVQIAVLPRTLFRAFAGLGVRRRRDLSIVDMLLENFGGRLQSPYLFLDASGRETTAAELDATIKTAILSIADKTVAAAAGGAGQDDREGARRAIAAVLADAIEARWTYTERPIGRLHSSSDLGH